MAPPIARDPRRLPTEVQRLQRNLAERSGGREFAVRAHWNGARTEVEYFYRGGQLICDETDLDEVLRAFDEVPGGRPDVREGPVGLRILDVGDRDVATLAEDLARTLGEGIVTPNHVLNAEGHSNVCPATEPLPWVGPVVDLPEPVGPGQARVAVVDTGYSKQVADDSGYARFSAVDGASQPDDEVYGAGTDIRPYGGHGTAAAAVVLTTTGADAVSVHVHVRDCLVGGGVDEITIIEDLVAVIEVGVDVISIQAGTYTRAGMAPKAFDAFYRKLLSKRQDVVLIAAAGNEGSDEPFWPAAYGWCTAVGALTRGGDARASWTNYGHWVDVYATGENVVVPYPNGTYTYVDGSSAPFTNAHALWSGTSFATPAVAGMVARRMIERNVTARIARDIVLSDARTNALPSTGPRVLV
jgi:Subtilase family